MSSSKKPILSKELRISVVVGIFLVFAVIVPSLFFAGFSFGNSAEVYRSQVVNLDDSLLHQPPFTHLEKSISLEQSDQEEVVIGSSDYPIAPYDISARDLELGGVVFVEWKTSLDSSVFGYRIYRSEQEGVLGDLVSELSGNQTYFYYDSSVLNNKRYYYTVRSIDKSKRESQNVEQYLGIATDQTPPQSPANVVFQDMNDGEQVKIVWQNPSDEDFSFIRIYRSKELHELGTIIQSSVTDESYVDTIEPGVEYYYSVTAVDISGNESEHGVDSSSLYRNVFKPSP